MKYLITGGCGFLGSNLASHLLRQKKDVVVFDNLYRFGASQNLEWLRSLGNFKFYHADIRNKNDVETAIKREKPDALFHLAGQVAMTTSIDRPYFDFEINVGGSVNVLEAVRHHAPQAVVVYSSTNKVYGDLENISYRESPTRYVADAYANGFAEDVPLDFHSPYGCSKGAADQYMLDYHRMFGLRTVVFRHSSMYGGRQFASFDQGWVGWFCQQALETKRDAKKEFTVSGNGKQVRDLAHADDMVDLYLRAVTHIEKAKGRAFNVGGGMENSLSILELLAFLEAEIGVKLRPTHIPVRESDQKIFVADLKKATEVFEWTPKMGWKQGMRMMIDWVQSNVK